jgi:hypothetical protein
MEEILKSLEGKNITKKSLFDFLSDINIENISSTHNDIVIDPTIEEIPQEKKRRGRKPKEKPVEKPVVEEIPQEKKRRGRKPKEKSVDKPVDKPVEHPKEKLNEIPDMIQLTKGIHSLINELLEKAITNIILECKFCSKTFNTRQDHHNHYSMSTMCNNMAYNEFKKL